MATIKELADQIYNQFEKRNRENGREFWALKDGKPEWMQELCHEAHGDMLPDDWRYDFILEAVSALSETDDPDDVQLEPDVYTNDLMQWLASRNDRAQYVNDAVEDYGLEPKGFDVVQVIGLGQLKEKEEVLSLVRSFLEKMVDEADAEEEDSK